MSVSLRKKKNQQLFPIAKYPKQKKKKYQLEKIRNCVCIQEYINDHTQGSSVCVCVSIIYLLILH